MADCRIRPQTEDISGYHARVYDLDTSLLSATMRTQEIGLAKSTHSLRLVGVP